MLMAPPYLPMELPDTSSRADVDEPTCVAVHPTDAVTRHLVSWHGMAAEIVQATRRDRLAFGYRGTRHLLAVCSSGSRREGGTFVEGLPRSILRDATHKLTFVPAGHAYCDLHEPRTLTRMLFFYFDPRHVPAATGLAPRLLFEDSTLLGMATRLERLVEAAGAGSPYFEALGTVLAYELLLSPDGRSSNSRTTAKGGLAPWQQRDALDYIEAHLTEPIALGTLAKLAGLSRYHFCRAFKQSLGLPPHQYHCQRRIEHAKRLLATTASSVTQVGLAVGYSETSSFTAAFHKTTGLTPTSYRRSMTGSPACEEMLS